MRSLPVVVLNPGGDLDPCVGKAHEQCPVQQLIAHAAVEALDLAVPHWPAGSNVMSLHVELSAPCENGVAGELGAIVADYHSGLAPLGDQLRQLGLSLGV